MKKRSRILEAIMAIIFIAATASAGGVYYTPLVPKTFECLVFELDIHQIRAVEAVDEKGSKYLHTDFVPVKTTQVFYFSQTTGKKYWQCWQGRVNSNGKSLNGSGESRVDIMIMNPKEGGTDGFIAFIMTLPRLDTFTPPVQAHLSGTFEGEWLEDEQRYVLKTGHGIISAHSNATTWDARTFMEQAVPSVQTSIAPAWGSFTVTRKILNENEIVNLIKK